MLWNYSKLTWMQSCATCSGVPFKAGVEPDDLQQFFPTSAIPCICVNLDSCYCNYCTYDCNDLTNVLESLL